MDKNYEVDEDLLHRKSLKYLRKIAYGKLNNNGNLLGLLNYKNVSLWWYLDLPIYYHLKHFINSYESEDLTNYNFNNDYVEILKYYITIILGLLFLNIKIFFRFLVSKLFIRNNRENTQKYNILVPSSSYSWRESGYNSNGKRDIMIGDVLDELINQKDFNIVACDVSEEFPKFGLKKIIEKKNAEEDLWKPLEFYLSFNILKMVYHRWIHYLKIWREFNSSDDFESLFKIEGSNLIYHESIKFHMGKFFYFNLLNNLFQIELLNEAIVKERINLILTYCDHCVFGLSSLIAGKDSGILTVSLQTSLMEKFGREYMYSKDETKYPIPDYLVLMGNYYKELLLENSFYEKESLVVVGQPRYDFLFKQDYSKKDFCNKIGIKSSEKIVLVTMIPLSSLDLVIPKKLQGSIAYLFLRTIFKLEKRLKGVKIVIKPHPRENNPHYKKIMKEDTSILVLDKNSDTYEAINACDVLVTLVSTTGLEALAMKKPVIVYSFNKEQENTPYIKSGAVIGVYDEKNLFNTIKQVLNIDHNSAHNIETRNNLRDKFLYEMMYKQDGQSSKRFVKFIRSILEN